MNYAGASKDRIRTLKTRNSAVLMELELTPKDKDSSELNALTMEKVHPLQTLSIHTSDVNSVDFAGDCILVTASGDKRVRVWEWQSGLGYVEVSYSPLMGHKYGVTCVKVSPQSTMLATSSIDGTTQLWNLRTGSKIHTMVQVSGESVRVCRFSPDSTFLVTAGDNGQVCLWDLVRRTLIRNFQKHDGAVQSVCFSPDSSWLITTCTFGVLKLFSTSELTDSCLTDNQLVTAFASVDDAHDLGVVGCDFSVYQRQVTSSDRPFAKVYQLVTCGNDHDVKLWDVTVVQDKCESQSATASITLSKIMEKHSSALTCVRFSANGLYIASSGLDKTTVVWETNTGRVAAVLVGHKRYVACCAFSRNGNLLATGSNDKSVIVWDLSGNLNLDSELIRHCAQKPHWTDQTRENTRHEQDVVQHAETCAGNEVTLLQTLDEHAGAVNSVDVYGNGMIASGSGFVPFVREKPKFTRDKFVRIWCADVNDNRDESEEPEEEKIFQEKSYSPLDGHKYSVNHVEFSPCGTMLASCSLDGTTIIWDTETGTQARATFVNSGLGIRVCRWSPDGTMIATAGDDEKTTLWDVNNMRELQVFDGHADAITAVAFTPDSRYIVTACSEGAWRMFDTADREAESVALICCDDGHDLGVQGCDFSPASSAPYAMPGVRQSPLTENTLYYLLATCGNDSLVKLWQVSVSKEEEGPGEGEEADKTEDDGEAPEKSGIAANASGTSWLGAAGAMYKEKRVLNGHGGNVMNVRFSPVHGEVLGSVATDRTARIWSVHSGVCLHVLENHESLVTACAFSKDTSLFVTGALDKTVLIWRVPQQLVSQSTLIDRLRHNRKKVSDWKANDIANWMNDIGLAALGKSIRGSYLNGRHLLSLQEDELVSRLGIEEDENMTEVFKKQLYWLKRENMSRTESIDEVDVPHEYLCPITHEIMREPVKCSDGFVYEKAAINEWFLCGKYTSPMTNEPLHDTTFTSAVALRNAICALLHGDRPES